MVRRVYDNRSIMPAFDSYPIWGRIVLAIVIMLVSVGGVQAQDAPPAEPASTSTPTETPIPAPTETPVPLPTETPVPAPTETPLPPPTETPVPAPTQTPLPLPTATLTPTPQPTVTPTLTPSPTPTSAPIRATQATAVCVLSGSATANFPGYAAFNCTPAKTSGQVFVSVTAPPAGWRYQVIGARTVPDTWRTNALSLDTQNLGLFQVHLGPVDANVRGCASVTVATWAPNVASEQSVLGACTQTQDQPVTAAVVGGVLPPVGFSHQDRVASGSLKIRVDNPSRRTGWTLDVSATDFAYTGPAPGQANLPASSLSVLRPGLPPLPLSTETQRLVSSGGAEAVYEFPMQVLIPGGSSAGSYTSTVTVVTASAPGK